MAKKIQKQIKEELSNGLEKWSGRFGEVNEYVEFKFPHRKISFVAQKSGENGWYTYKVWPGKKGRVETLTLGTTKDKAVKLAEQSALDFG